MDYSIIIYIVFGVLPSLVWLSYYLSKDLHPEPKRMIVNIFLWGSLMALPVFLIETGCTYLLDATSVSPLVYNLIKWFLIISFTEEFFKYLVVRIKVIDSPHLDEPMDAMIYMVVAALGFAAVENILYLFAPTGAMSFNQLIDRALFVDFVRFIGATFLHTLCSGLIGYSLAVSFCRAKKKYIPVVFGVLMATFLHGLYDFSIMTSEGNLKLIIPVVVILALAFGVFSGFETTKRMKSSCNVE